MLRIFERLCERLNNSPGADSMVIIKLVSGTRLAKFIHSQANDFGPKDTTNERKRVGMAIHYGHDGNLPFRYGDQTFQMKTDPGGRALPLELIAVLPTSI